MAPQTVSQDLAVSVRLAGRYRAALLHLKDAALLSTRGLHAGYPVRACLSPYLALDHLFTGHVQDRLLRGNISHIQATFDRLGPLRGPICLRPTKVGDLEVMAPISPPLYPPICIEGGLCLGLTHPIFLNFTPPRG